MLDPKPHFRADIIADSINPAGNRITTFLLVYPRFVHAELLTHRAFSRNAASSRAIPIEKFIEQVRNNPAMPVRWGANGKGMQDHGVLDEKVAAEAQRTWIDASGWAIHFAKKLRDIGVHKQIANRLLEPFQWMKTLVTATQYSNFFALRVHKDAQPELQYLSYLMLESYVASKPRELNWGDWHLPYGDTVGDNVTLEDKIRICVARAARTSYNTIEGKIDVAQDVLLHDDLSMKCHWSPFEHPAQADMSSHGNFVGWRPYRKDFVGENQFVVPSEHLENYRKEMGYGAPAQKPAEVS